MNCIQRLLFLCLTSFPLVSGAAALAKDAWTYIRIDDSRQKWGDWAEPEWLRYFGLDAADADLDGDLDLVGPAWDHYAPLHFWRNDARE